MSLELPSHQHHSKKITLDYHSLGHLLFSRCKNSPEKKFIFFPCKNGNTIDYSYRDFEQKVRRVQRYLDFLGLRPGDRIAIVIPNSAEFLLLFFGALCSGITVVPINPELAVPELSYILNDSNIKALFFDFRVRVKVEELITILSSILFKQISSLPDFEPLVINAVSGVEKIDEVKLTDEAVIIYTSGTTGSPKGVVLTHLNLIADAKAVAEFFHFDSSTRTLCILPLFHNNGEVVTLLAPLFGGGSTVIVEGKVSLFSFWGLVDKFTITWTSVMPAILNVLLSLPYECKNNSLQGIICGGQVLTKNVQDNFEKRFAVPIFEGYGLTETTSFACFNDYPRENRHEGSVGRPLPINDIEIFKEDDSRAIVNEYGEICIRGINVAKEYLNQEEKNRVAFKNGWFHSGDYGRKDNDGYIYFTTRKDYLIRKGGESIYPAEVENALYVNSMIKECAVIGIPDNLLGEDVCVFVQLTDDAKITAEEIKKFLSSRIAHYKCPKKIIIINYLPDLPEIPKGPTKKILYRVLKDYYLKNYLV